jgi:hypothetical protein
MREKKMNEGNLAGRFKRDHYKLTFICNTVSIMLHKIELYHYDHVEMQK